MKIIEIQSLENGAHRNQSWNSETIPDGWALIPDGFETPNFPFGEIVAEEVTYYNEVEVLHDVVKTREVVNEAGETVTEEFVDQEYVTEKQPYTVMEVTSWTPIPIPEPEQVEIEPTEDELQWQAITDLEIAQMETEQALTDLEIAQLEG